MTAALIVVGALVAFQAVALILLTWAYIGDRRDWRQERSELLNRIKPETAQPLPGQTDDPDPPAVDLEHDEAYHQHQQELEEAR